MNTFSEYLEEKLEQDSEKDIILLRENNFKKKIELNWYLDKKLNNVED